MTRPVNLYRHFDSKGRLLYIGVSMSALTRLQAHRSHSRWFDNIARVEIESLPNRKAALLAEKRAIVEESPKFNVMHSAPSLPKDTPNGEAISESIKLSGLSDKHIAETLGIPAPTVWRWRKGLTKPNIVNIMPLSRALDCDPLDLIPGEEDD